MAAIDDRLADVQARLLRIGDRQELLIQAVDGQTDCLGILNDKLAELLEWANKPPSNKLEEALGNIAAALIAIDQRLAALPDAVAAAVIARLR